MATLRKVDFYRLPRPVQDRFAAATRRSAPPAPLLYSRAPRNTVWAYLAASGGLALGAVLVLFLGFGEVASPFGLHGPKLLTVDIVLLSGAAYCVVHAMGLIRALDSLPWRAGTYLFPGCVVDARGPVLDVWSVGDAEAIERVTGPEPALAFKMRDGSRVLVPAPSLELAEKADAALGSLRQELARAIAEEDPQVLAELDPLHDRAMSSPIGPTEAMKKALVVSNRFDWAIAVVAGVLLGLGLGSTRNAMSDEAMFRIVKATGTVAQYQAYLGQGGKHSDEVRDLLLPRAQLREAEAQGTVDAVQAFADALAKSSGGSKIDADIDAALRRAMLVALDGAKKAGTVTAIDDLAKKYPNAARAADADIKAARHAVFVSVLDAWKKKSKPDANTSSFMERLLAYTEAQGPACEIHFRMKPSKTIDDADRSIKHSGHYPAPDALPSKYLTVDAMRPREEKVAAALADGFSADFPADVLAVKAGAPLDADAAAPAGPALVVDYTADWSRANSLSEHPPTVLAGFIFLFESSFGLPQGAPLKVNARAWRGPEPWRVKGGANVPREDFEQKVYDAMFDGAFDTLQKRLTDVLL